MFVVKIVIKCIIEKYGKVLFIKEAARSSWRPGTWALPGGKLEPQETLQDAIKRELFEETGLRVKVLGLLRIEEILAHINSDDRLVHHFIFVCKQTGGSLKNPDHHVAAFQWIDEKELRKIPISDLAEYYYKDLITYYSKNKKKLVSSKLIKTWNAYKDNKINRWVSG